MKLDLEGIPWRDWAVHAVVSYNSTRALTEDFLHLRDREFQVFFSPKYCVHKWPDDMGPFSFVCL